MSSLPINDLHKMDDFCRQILESTEANMNERAKYTILVLLSLLALFSIIFTILTNEKVNKHPSLLIASICINEAILEQLFLIHTPSITSISYMCYFEANYKLYRATQTLGGFGTSYYSSFEAIVLFSE